MIVLGIDPGLATVGYGVVDKRPDGSIMAVDYGVIETPPNETIATRLAMIYEGVKQLMLHFKPEEIALEQIFYFKNQKTIIPVAEARGVAILALVQTTGKLFEYTPLQVKSVMTGNGRADKKQVQNMVKLLLNLDNIPKPDDAADALAVAITHCKTNNISKNQI
ncbi:MAG: crossover junction endodeoxyribonuclease RuvC [Christensenellaceae bacterium]|jgi:crossover junction endodeoxyribonuclease RuvC|nr:crossover junction endodeoxyribonuclease RuvC [Christensenellaceae bacterium]